MEQNTDSGKRYSIGEVSKLTGVDQSMLRQWEKHFDALDPQKHLSSNNRLYTEWHIKIIRRIKVLRMHEKMTYKGANKKLNEELWETETPKDLRGMLNLADKIADEARAIITIFDPDTLRTVSDQEEYSEAENIQTERKTPSRFDLFSP